MEDNMTIEQSTELVEGNEVLNEGSEDVIESSSANIGLGLAALAVLTGTVAIAYRKRDAIKAKRTERQIKRLEKKGYNISKLENAETGEDVDPEEDTEE